MTRGQVGSLGLTCTTLAFATSRRFIPAHSNWRPKPLVTTPSVATEYLGLLCIRTARGCLGTLVVSRYSSGSFPLSFSCAAMNLLHSGFEHVGVARPELQCTQSPVIEIAKRMVPSLAGISFLAFKNGARCTHLTNSRRSSAGALPPTKRPSPGHLRTGPNFSD